MITLDTLTAVLATRTPASDNIYLTLLFGCYLIGAFPTSYLFVKQIVGIDIRQYGTGNSGATNASRVLGSRFFFIILAIDALKAFGALWLVTSLLPDMTLLGQLWCAAALLIGNSFSVFLGFRGGKGVATGAGLLAFFLPAQVVIAYLVIFLITRVIGRRGDVAALSTSLLGALWVQHSVVLTAELGAAVWVYTIWVWVRHWRNIVHLIGIGILER